LISRAENQIDYHACNSFALWRLRKLGALPMAVKAANLCDVARVVRFPARSVKICPKGVSRFHPITAKAVYFAIVLHISDHRVV
jgi:hypothetical protein